RCTTSPSSSSTRRRTPCAAGCWGPKLTVKLRSEDSAMAAEMITPGQRLPCALVPSAADLKVRTPKTEIPRQSYQAVALETRDSDRLLCARRERPRSRRAAKQRYELATPHSITSSARC